MDEDGSGTEKYGRTTQRADGRAKFAGVSLCKRGKFFFGERIDALSDLIAFGVAPAMIGFGMRLIRWYFIPVYGIFVLCALIRLA